MEPDNATRRTRVVAANMTLEDPTSKNRWIVTLVGTAVVWVLDFPTPKGQVAIPFPWSAIDRLSVVKK